MARHHQFVPLKKQGQLLWVAMLDPTDMIAMDVITAEHAALIWEAFDAALGAPLAAPEFVEDFA